MILLTPFAIYILSAFLFLLSEKRIVHYILCTIASCTAFAAVVFISRNLDQDFDASIVSIAELANIHLKPDKIGIIFALLCSFLCIPSCVYAVSYMHQNNESNKCKFFFYFNLSIAITMALAFSANLITLFVFYELLTLSTYPLVIHHGTDSAKRSGKIYLSYLVITSIGLFFPAIIIVFNLAGTFEFDNNLVINFQSTISRDLLFLLFAFGIAKSAIMPVHKWLTAAMVAPTPVSALLHAVAVVKAGVFCIIKIAFYVFYVSGQDINSSKPLLYVAGLTVIFASFAACKKTKLKEVLAYSTISQLSYIVMTTAILTRSAIESAIAYMVIHGFAKITLFFTVGAIYTSTKFTNTKEIYGIAKLMPVTFTAFCIGAFSMIGLPPTAAFLGKYIIFSSAFAANQYFVIFVLLASTALNAMYFLPIILRMLANSEQKIINEAKCSMLLPYALTAFCCLLFYYYLDSLLAVLNQ